MRQINQTLIVIVRGTHRRHVRLVPRTVLVRGIFSGPVEHAEHRDGIRPRVGAIDVSLVGDLEEGEVGTGDLVEIERRRLGQPVAVVPLPRSVISDDGLVVTPWNRLPRQRRVRSLGGHGRGRLCWQRVAVCIHSRLFIDSGAIDLVGPVAHLLRGVVKHVTAHAVVRFTRAAAHADVVAGAVWSGLVVGSVGIGTGYGFGCLFGQHIRYEVHHFQVFPRQDIGLARGDEARGVRIRISDKRIMVSGTSADDLDFGAVPELLGNTFPILRNILAIWKSLVQLNIATPLLWEVVLGIPLVLARIGREVIPLQQYHVARDAFGKFELHLIFGPDYRLLPRGAVGPRGLGCGGDVSPFGIVRIRHRPVQLVAHER
mmetsp:Transcript_16963/g.40604  ORF Transcript_16963/g.40604 Transcript_16963/m.40604 type:complete len:372 (+) Transcript_16963:3340-4455(+)